MAIKDSTQWNTSHGHKNKLPDSTKSGPVPLPNRDNGPFQRIGANQAKHSSGADKKGGFGE
jgi:hypothetical protein